MIGTGRPFTVYEPPPQDGNGIITTDAANSRLPERRIVALESEIQSLKTEAFRLKLAMAFLGFGVVVIAVVTVYHICFGGE